MRFLPIFFVFTSLISMSPAYSCPMVSPTVTQNDVKNAPTNMLAIQAEILSIKSTGRLDIYPHHGFQVKMKVMEKYQGEEIEDIINIEYGPCQSSPGDKGDLIYVLASKRPPEMKWYAPQFW